MRDEPSTLRRIGAKTLCLALSLSLAPGCTWRPVRTPPPDLRAAVERGDKLRVVTTDGRSTVLFVSDADDQGLVGVTEEGNRFVALRYSEIASVENRRLSGAGKLGVTLLVLGGVVATVYVAVMVAFLAGGGGGNATPPAAANAVPERAAR